MSGFDNSSGFCKYLPSNRKKSGIARTKSKKPRKVGKPQPFLIATPSGNHTKSSRNKNQSNRRDSENKNTRKPDRRPVNWWMSNASKQRIDAKDYNIFHIDSKIKEKLSSNISSIPELEYDLVKTLWILQNGDDPAQKVMAKHQASLLRKRIQDLESTLEMTFYIFRTADLLEEYRTLIKNAGAKSFVTVDPCKCDGSAARMIELVGQYLCVAQDYIEIDNMSQKPKKMVCPACQGIDFLLSVEDDSIYICKSCQTEIEILDDAPSFKDTDRVNMSSKYTYTRKGHFVDAVKRFMGTQNTDPQKIQNAVAVIRDEMAKHNLMAEQGNKNSISKDHTYMFLSEQGLSNHYEDLNLLFHVITDEPCPDINEYVDALYELFDVQES
ncbi:MAG: hypothetical protein KAR20_09725, partial [Candidatus Heimdallarchaeota archaeon]|nr:hypothetical protein [Candidatus Heimdallarchaeota archaeon]